MDLNPDEFDKNPVVVHNIVVGVKINSDQRLKS